MAMNFEELDSITRQYMLTEFEIEEAGPNPYRSKVLSARGMVEFSELMYCAIIDGNEESLISSLIEPTYWYHVETYISRGVRRERRVNISQAASRLGLTEFNTWYVRGFAKRLMNENVTMCQIYAAAMSKGEESAECQLHDGQILLVQDIYNGHRAKYWPEPGNKTAISVPVSPNCHHTIRRMK